MKVTKRDAKLIIVLVGLLIFLGLYMLVYNPTLEKIEAVEARIAELKPQVDELEAHYLKLNTYETSISQNRTYVLAAMQALPADVKEEDTLSYLLTMEKKEGFHIESVTFRPAALLSQFEAVYHENGQDVPATVNAYRHTTIMNGDMTYGQAKEVLDYIYSSTYQTVLDSLGLTYDASIGRLTVSYELSQFTLDWPGGVYRPEPLPSATFGVPELFGIQIDPNAEDAE